LDHSVLLPVPALRSGRRQARSPSTGRRVIVELRKGAESDLGGRYTLKRWRVTEVDAEGVVTEIELCPDNRAYGSFRLRTSDGEIRVVAELLEVLA
jgi:hypothetical protein